jgi:hypothetical protein
MIILKKEQTLKLMEYGLKQNQKRKETRKSQELIHLDQIGVLMI